MIGSASTALTTAAGSEQERDLAQAARRPCRAKPRMSPRAASRESVGKSTVAIATENIPCGSM